MYNYEYFRQIDSHLEQFNKENEAYGVEAINGSEWINSYYQTIRLLYVNMGDPHIETLIYDTKKRKFYQSDLATILEQNNI